MLIPFWLVFTEPYVVKPSPLKLYEAIHPTYYIGLSAIALLIAILSVKSWKNFNTILNPYLAVAILATFYLQLPPIALFEHPISDHTIHLVPAFYMLREGNIYMPNYPHPETVSPQLFASIFIMIMSLPSPLENLHRISLFVLSLLTTLYIYIFMRRLEAGDRFAMMASVLNMGLIHVHFMFLRQTYAMPLYVMLVLLVFMAQKEGRASHSILATVTALTFIMSDPAHVLLTIIPLMLFTMTWKGFSLFGKVNYHRFRSLWIFVLFVSVAFLSWIINRYPLLPISLWRIAKTMWDVFIRSINTFTLPTQESPAAWGKSIGVTYSDYYMVLYKVRVLLIAFSVIFPAMLLFIYAFLYKLKAIRFEIMYLATFFAITSAVLIARGYGFTYTPWASMTLFLLLKLINNASFRYKLYRTSIIIAILFVLIAASVSPHITHSGGKVRLSSADINAILWLGEYSPQAFSLISPGYGGWLSETAYIMEGQYVRIADYLFYEGLTYKSINNLAKHNAVIIPEAALIYFEKTEACYFAIEMFEMLNHKLNNTHNLIYNSGNPFVCIYLAQLT